jgi:flagellar protein FlbD
MICLTRLNGQSITVNAELIQWVESAPDTVITLTSGEKLMVLESAEQVRSAAMAYRREIHSLAPRESEGTRSLETRE